MQWSDVFWLLTTQWCDLAQAGPQAIPDFDVAIQRLGLLAASPAGEEPTRVSGKQAGQQHPPDLGVVRPGPQANTKTQPPVANQVRLSRDFIAGSAGVCKLSIGPHARFEGK